MRIGHFVSVVSRLRGYERNVSGHIQLPLHLMRLLAEADHDVRLITNFIGNDRVLPWCMPPKAAVHYVRDSRRRLGSLEKKRQPVSGVYPIAFLRQAAEIIRIARRERLDLLHLHGHVRTVQLAAILKALGLPIPTLATLFHLPRDRYGPLSRTLMRCAGPVVTATDYVAERCRSMGIDTHLLRHGLVRDLRNELPQEQMSGRRHRVLFWRDLTYENGADLAMATFDELAPEFPEVSFDLAVRPQPSETPGVDELCRRHPNVHVHRFPYPPPVSVAALMSEAVVVMLPFREFTIQPQLSILESLSAGVPVVASDLGSTRELIEHEKTGFVGPVGETRMLTEAVRELVSQPRRARLMGERAELETRRKWNWTSYVEKLVELYETVM